jgi:hypothetical protein
LNLAEFRLGVAGSAAFFEGIPTNAGSNFSIHLTNSSKRRDKFGSGTFGATVVGFGAATDEDGAVDGTADADADATGGAT